MTQIRMTVLDGFFSIHRFSEDSEIPSQIFDSGFFTISKTEDELSVVCDSGIRFDSAESSGHWSCLKVIGPLDFSLTGILAGISASLAEKEISIFAISTFETDYFLPRLIDSAG